MFQRIESVLHSEIRSFGHPRAALLGFVLTVLAHNLLSVLKRSAEYVHQDCLPQLDVSTYHLAVQLRSGYEGMLIALPDSTWLSWSDTEPHLVAQRFEKNLIIYFECLNLAMLFHSFAGRIPLGGPLRIVAWSIWSGRERSSHIHFLQVP